MNNKTVIEFRFYIICRIMEISEHLRLRGVEIRSPNKDFETHQKCFWDWEKLFWDPSFSRNYSIPLTLYQNGSELGGSWMVTKIHTSYFLMCSCLTSYSFTKDVSVTLNSFILLHEKDCIYQTMFSDTWSLKEVKLETCSPNSPPYPS